MKLKKWKLNTRKTQVIDEFGDEVLIGCECRVSNLSNLILASKAPEMLEMLQRLKNDYGNYTQNILQDSHRVNRIKEIEKLIKEATKL